MTEELEPVARWAEVDALVAVLVGASLTADGESNAEVKWVSAQPGAEVTVEFPSLRINDAPVSVKAVVPKQIPQGHFCAVLTTLKAEEGRLTSKTWSMTHKAGEEITAFPDPILNVMREPRRVTFSDGSTAELR